jgi:hypothetical protein
MKMLRSRRRHERQPTLAELISTVAKLSHNERLGALVVADLVNSGRVRLGGQFHGRRVMIG